MPKGQYNRSLIHRNPHSLATRQRMSKSALLRFSDPLEREKIRHGIGKKLSLEHREKLRIAHLGHKHSKATRLKLSESHKGNKSVHWRGGVSTENHRIRDGIEIKLWREAVFKRDKWKCRKCDQVGGVLRAHHIRNFAQWIELRFAIDNGVTFCDSCHLVFHKIFGRKDNNPEQLAKFLHN